MTWIESGGGPLIMMTAAARPHRRGTDPPLEGEGVVANSRWDGDTEACDYDRACDVSDYLGVIDVGGLEAVVLGDEPMSTTWLGAPDGGTIARWMHADAAPDDRALATAVERRVQQDFSFLVHAGGLHLFDAAYPGAEASHVVVCDLGPGRYTIETLMFAPDAATAFVVHHFRATPTG